MKRRALVSVSNKEGVYEFCHQLLELGWEIISTGGTYSYLVDQGLTVIEVSQITDFPEMLDGRVKTLHPNIHGGILSKRTPEHESSLEKQGIVNIDMVVCNLYPFEEKMLEGAPHEIIVENIDIGGPSMIRSAAKNYPFTFVVCDNQDYPTVIEHINDTDTSYRLELARKAFSHTARYDAIIAQYFNKYLEVSNPDILVLPYDKVESLRYGENPHQNASYYALQGEKMALNYTQLHGKELSYNNINDLSGAVRSLRLFQEPTVVAVKHANPCAIAQATTIEEAFVEAKSCDPESIFGGIIALNRPIDLNTAVHLSEIFLEVILAPSYTQEALSLLTQKKNIRLLECKNLLTFTEPSFSTKDVLNGILVQERDNQDDSDSLFKVVSKRKPTDEELHELDFAWKAVRACDSNAIVVTNNGKTLGIGQGEVQRYWACEKAIDRSRFDVKGSVMASDGFFFEDTIERCYKAGITAIIQPGGSIKDPKVIALADSYNMALVFTGTRHFKH